MDRAAAVPGCESLSWGSSAQLPAGWFHLQPGLLATPESRVRLVAQKGQGRVLCSCPCQPGHAAASTKPAPEGLHLGAVCSLGLHLSSF